MPAYGYQCRKCSQRFERIESVSEHGTHRVRCPKCKSRRVEPVLGEFFARTSRKS